MKLTKSIVAENSLRFMQSNRDKEFTVIDVAIQGHSTEDVTPELNSYYKSFLNNLVAQKNLAKKYNSAPHLYPDIYYLEDFQFQYWIRKGFQV